MRKLMMCLSLSLWISGCGTLTDKAADDWEIKLETSVTADDCTAECGTTLQRARSTEDEEAVDNTGVIEALKGKAVP